MSAVRKSLALLTAAAIALPALTPGVALADPPPWAPAWGHRGQPAPQPQKVRCVREMVRGKVKETCEYDYGSKESHKSKPHRQQEQQRVTYKQPYGIEHGTCNRQLVGSLLGAAMGAVAGSGVGKGKGRLAAVASGTVLGLILGGSIGRSMDKADQGCVSQAMEHARENQPIAWNNPDTQEQYTVTPVRTFQTNEGRYCREYQAQATVGGKVQETYGTACRQPDGAWEIVN